MTPQLTVTRGSTAGKKVTLSASQACLIGSSPEAALPVEGEGIAARHLVVKALKAGGFGVKGLAGAFKLNGRAVSAAKLSDGDRIVIGDVEILYGKDGLASSRQLGGFRLISPIGKGGMGTVYRAEQVSLNREVALKILSKQLTKDPVFIARFQAEAKAAARLHHPNVVQVFDVDHESDTYFYAMELMHRGSLEDLLAKQGKIDPERAMVMISEAAQGLSYAESLHIVHRDIKPDNLMLDHHGHVKIADLGLAQSDAHDSGSLQGTPHFMSPEQVLRKPLDHRSDLYALGCTFYRLVTGQAPFKKQSVKEILIAQVKEQPVPAHKLVAEVSSEISEVIDRLMAKDPDDRYQSADELVEDLATLLTPATKRGLLYTVTGIALAGVIASLVYVMNLPEPETKIVTKLAIDPDAAVAKARQRETAAENAMLRLQLQNLQGIDKAEALEMMAQTHRGTKAAGVALQAADKLRVEHANSSAVSKQRQRVIAAAISQLQLEFETAMESLDFLAAATAISVDNIPSQLRSEAALETLVATLGQRLQVQAESHMSQLATDLETAKLASDTEVLQAAVDAAETALDPVSGWVSRVLSESDPLRRTLALAKSKIAELARAEIDSRDRAAWRSLRQVMMARGGVIEQIAALQFPAAREQLRRLAANQDGFVAADRARHLADALVSAEDFRQRFIDAIAQGQVNFSAEDGQTPRRVLAIETGPGGVSIRIRSGRGRNRDELLPLTGIEHMQQLFTIAGVPDEALSRNAFLGVLGLADGMRRAQQYLATVDRARIEPGPTGFAIQSPDLAAFAAVLAGHSKTAWANALASELEACVQISAGLQAFSTGQLLIADRLVSAILNQGKDLLVVQSLH